jgi:hypothetical protein
MTSCKQVEDKLVAGELLEPAEAEHLAGCAACRGLRDTAERLAPALARPGGVDPALLARTLAGAEARMTRRPFGVFVAGGAVALAVIALLAVGLRGRAPRSQPGALPTPGLVDIPHEIRVAERSVEERLVRLSDTETNRRLSARWSFIESPLTGFAWVAEGARAPLAPVEVEKTP